MLFFKKPDQKIAACGSSYRGGSGLRVNLIERSAVLVGKITGQGLTGVGKPGSPNDRDQCKSCRRLRSFDVVF
jgi:hypothetical protein